jgi:hypothetical protein
MVIVLLQHRDISGKPKEDEREMSKQKQGGAAFAEGLSTEAAAPIAEPQKQRLPLSLTLAFVIAIVVGLALGLSSQSRKESRLYNAIESADASVVAEKSGLNDAYGVVLFKTGQFPVAEYLSECELNPPFALKLFRRAMDSGSRSAKLIAMYSANFLSSTKQLEKDDFDKIVSIMRTSGGGDIQDLRRAAQRMVADLTALDTIDASKFAATPPNVKATAEGEPVHRIMTQKQKLANGKEITAIRWSNVDLATEWWQVHSPAGAWNKDLQRYVIAAGAAPSK